MRCSTAVRKEAGSPIFMPRDTSIRPGPLNAQALGRLESNLHRHSDSRKTSEVPCQMQSPDLTPRSDHVGRELTVPHEGLYRTMRGFLADLDAAERSYRKEVAAIREKLGIPAQYMETTDVERYS